MAGAGWQAEDVLPGTDCPIATGSWQGGKPPLASRLGRQHPLTLLVPQPSPCTCPSLPHFAMGSLRPSRHRERAQEHRGGIGATPGPAPQQQREDSPRLGCGWRNVGPHAPHRPDSVTFQACKHTPVRTSCCALSPRDLFCSEPFPYFWLTLVGPPASESTTREMAYPWNLMQERKLGEVVGAQ